MKLHANIYFVIILILSLLRNPNLLNYQTTLLWIVIPSRVVFYHIFSRRSSHILYSYYVCATHQKPWLCTIPMSEGWVWLVHDETSACVMFSGLNWPCKCMWEDAGEREPESNLSHKPTYSLPCLLLFVLLCVRLTCSPGRVRQNA